MENYSKQREEIIGIIKELHTYPTAEEIYILAKKKDPAVSRSTVYRNLKFLGEKGVIIQIAISSGANRYDYIKNGEPHGYIICSECGQVFDFLYDFDVQKMKKSIFSQTGVTIFQNSITVKGICSNCREKLKN